MKRGMVVFVLAVCVVASVVPYGEGGFRVTESGWKVWMAPSGGWEVGGIGTWPMDKVRVLTEGRPPDAKELKLLSVIAEEPGEWLTFSIKFGRVQRVVFTKSTRIVVVDEKGRRHESEGCFFCPDMWQTQLYDTRKMNVVVTKGTVYCRKSDGRPALTVKFAEGSVRRKDIVEFEVVGAIEDTVQRGGQ